MYFGKNDTARPIFLTLRITTNFSGSDDDENVEVGNTTLGGENYINY